MAYQNSGSFRDFIDTERFFIAPVLQWNISDRTTLIVNFEYLNDNSFFDRGIPALSDGSLVLPITRTYSYPGLNDYTQTTYRVGYTFDHRFSDNWRIRNALSISSDKRGGSRTDIADLLIDNQFLPREFRDDESLTETYALQTDLIGKFQTGSIQHQLLLGFDLTRRSGIGRGGDAILPPFDIFNPNYDTPEITDFQPFSFAGSDRTNTLGIYVQDQSDRSA
ncbi:MAG: hypothetical protein HC866_11140 [Leptolyngbyaceae cyanobacterium RU_5_1]|nr:hypothetical protein [Leptolyngbyaceae cyanobacterium RU_5_1]